MNPWRRAPIDKNPYVRNAFRVARVPREVVSRRALVTLIGRTQRIVQEPGAHTIRGEAVTVADINAAEKILLDAKQRIIEELLVHATEGGPGLALRDFEKEIDAELQTAGADAAAACLHAVRARASDLAQNFAATNPSSPSFGALELDVPPPFGWPEE
jgi:hypothetical protein